MSGITYKEYVNRIESAINNNRLQFFPLDKELRKERLLRLGKEIGVALAGFDEADAKDFIQSSYSRILVKNSFDSIGVVLDMKDWANTINEGIKQGNDWIKNS